MNLATLQEAKDRGITLSQIIEQIKEDHDGGTTEDRGSDWADVDIRHFS